MYNLIEPSFFCFAAPGGESSGGECPGQENPGGAPTEASGASAAPRSSRRGRVRRAPAGETLQQLPFGQIERSIKPIDLISEDHLEAIHQASLTILSEIGIEYMSARARQIFREAGAEVDEASQMVRLAPELVTQALASAPERFSLTPRNPAHALKFGGGFWVAGSVAGPPQVHDGTRGRRPGNLEDFTKLIQLSQAFNAVQMFGYHPVSPIDIPANTRHLDTYYVCQTQGDKAYKISAIGRERTQDAIDMMAIAKGIDREAMKREPAIMTTISINSPRRVDEAMTDGLEVMALHNQVCSITPFTLMGAMTPVTLAGALAQHNAEALSAIVLTQLINPGAPVLYGTFTSNVDLRSGAPAFGTPENSRANLIAGQLARSYKLPYRSSNACSSNLADEQATYESMMSLWSAIAGGAHFLHHGAGWLEGGLKASFEKLVLDAELLQEMALTFGPFTADVADLAVEAIRKVPPGGHFFGEQHTLERYETAFYAPMTSDWRNHETWEADGAKSTRDRLTEIWQQVLAGFQPPALADDRREALDAFMAKRKEELAGRDPA